MSTATKKIALITGANKGIGFEAARQLGKAGFTVLIGARKAELGQKAAATLQADQIDAHFVAIDLDDHAAITAAAATIAADFDHLDVLINNAAIIDHTDGAASVSSLEAVERTMRTNFLGTVAVTQAMLPLLRKAPSARIVNVSSGLGSVSENANPAWPYYAVKYLAYSCSKAALNMFTVHLAYELRDTPIKVNSADPGYTATDLNNNQGHQTVAEGTAETVRLALLPDDGPTSTFSDNAGPIPW
jgi:NAD(P)-dependent dehydrogenase (short-subunit alcohol dehydrogenase family)